MLPVEPQVPSRANLEKQNEIRTMQLFLKKYDFFQSLYRNSSVTLHYLTNATLYRINIKRLGDGGLDERRYHDGSIEALFSRIKLQTPVWRCSGYPDEMISANMAA